MTQDAQTNGDAGLDKGLIEKMDYKPKLALPGVVLKPVPKPTKLTRPQFRFEWPPCKGHMTAKVCTYPLQRAAWTVLHEQAETGIEKQRRLRAKYGLVRW